MLASVPFGTMFIRIRPSLNVSHPWCTSAFVVVYTRSSLIEQNRKSNISLVNQSWPLTSYTYHSAQYGTEIAGATIPWIYGAHLPVPNPFIHRASLLSMSSPMLGLFEIDWTKSMSSVFACIIWQRLFIEITEMNSTPDDRSFYQAFRWRCTKSTFLTTIIMYAKKSMKCESSVSGDTDKSHTQLAHEL
jgi:hypothetical protein